VYGISTYREYFVQFGVSACLTPLSHYAERHDPLELTTGATRWSFLLELPARAILWSYRLELPAGATCWSYPLELPAQATR